MSSLRQCNPLTEDDANFRKRVVKPTLPRCLTFHRRRERIHATVCAACCAGTTTRTLRPCSWVTTQCRHSMPPSSDKPVACHRNTMPTLGRVITGAVPQLPSCRHSPRADTTTECETHVAFDAWIRTPSTLCHTRHTHVSDVLQMKTQQLQMSESADSPSIAPSKGPRVPLLTLPILASRTHA